MMPELVALGQVLFIDIVLAGDNAIVVGMAAAGLPADQRRRAILWGGRRTGTSRGGVTDGPWASGGPVGFRYPGRRRRELDKSREEASMSTPSIRFHCTANSVPARASCPQPGLDTSPSTEEQTWQRK